MRSTDRRIFLASLVIALLALGGVAQSEVRYEELPNFHEVNSRLYRGAQPRAGGMNKLAALGIKTVLNLRREDDDTRSEAAAALAAGLRYFNVGMPGTSKPSDDQINRALAIINSPENQPVFVHCKRGADRTGTVIACYHILKDGWTASEAKKEADHYGMWKTEFGMKHYIEDFYARHKDDARPTDDR
ncbi:MAG: tyrosine-protein phosphatase [Blastocatellia bacterium]|jgi:protein tyrosine/serine phosphatase|nr:tyrosine-protein phosphatase [Blastocatellia bacterium]